MTIWQPFQLFRHTNDAHLSNCFILETNACIFIITSRARLWWYHGLRTPGEEIAFTAQPKINSHSQSFRYGRSIFCLSATSAQIFRFLWFLHWVSVVRGLYDCSGSQCCRINWHFYVICDEININIFCYIMSACFCPVISLSKSV